MASAEASKRRWPSLFMTFLVVAVLGVLSSFAVKRFIIDRHFANTITIDSLSLTPAQLELLAELGLDRQRLSLLMSSLNASKLFVSNSVESLLESFEELLVRNKEAAARLYRLAVANAEQYTLAARIASASFPKQAARIKRVLRESSKGLFEQTVGSAEEALEEWRRFVKDSPQGKAVGEWCRKVSQEYRHMLTAASMALPQRVVQWCERAIDDLLAADA